MRRLAVISLSLLLLGFCVHGAEKSYAFRMLDASKGLPENNVRDMMLLPDGLMCIQTSSWLCFYDGAGFKNWRWDPVRVPYAEYSGQDRIAYDADNDRVILHTRDYVWAFDRKTECFVYDIQQPEAAPHDTLGQFFRGGDMSHTQTAEASSGLRWFMSDKHLVSFDPRDGKLAAVEDIPAGSDDLFTSIAVDGRDNLWVGSARSGVRLFYSDGTVLRFPYLQRIGAKPVYPHLDISRIYADPKGGVWIATQQEGLLFWHPDLVRINTVNGSTLKGGAMPDESVKCLAESSDGKVLVGTIHGLLRYDPVTQTMEAPWPELKDELVIGLFVDSLGRIWAGTFYNGLYCIDGRRVRHYTWPQKFAVDVAYQKAMPNFNCVRALTQDAGGQYWISVYGGLGRFDPENGGISLLKDSCPGLERYMMVRDIFLMKDGSIVASGDNGRFRYDPLAGEVVDIGEEDSFTFTNQVFEDTSGRLWLAESGGLYLKEGTSEPRCIMSSGVIMGVAEDDDGVVWAMSTSGISGIRVEADGSVLRTDYGEDDGLDCGSFFPKSVLKHSDGTIYFGGSSGMCVIPPRSLRIPDYGVPPRISSFTVGGEEMSLEDIRLPYDRTSLRFTFTNLNFANPRHSRYRYRLAGFEDEWQMSASSPLGEAGYTFLEPGKYVFEVEASNNGVDWSRSVSVPVLVRPPFWRSTAAMFVYAALLMVGIWIAVTLFYRRARHKMALQRAEEQRLQEDELNQMKFRFFTNISHELRTPLSLIILPLESLMKDKKGSDEYTRLDTMHRNAKALLDMVNHLLDFRKLEMGGEKLQLRNGSISEFVAGVMETFRDGAEKKRIRLSLVDDADNCLVAFDSTMMQKVVNNLLSNALKFTPEGGSIELCLSMMDDGSVRIDVRDSGIGIPSSDLPHVFDRFYRSPNAGSSTGSGIGLNLVKQYVEMHNGTVSVTSEVGKGSVFSVVLPQSPLEVTSEAGDAGDDPAAIQANGRKCIMVVDDNADFRHYLRDELSRSYKVCSASDGEDCLDKLRSVTPDIIVCDVMMPKMDGFELTKRIKNDVETSHIPVVLITARMSEDIRIKGYDCGSDAYLSKPFRMEMLEARISNLLEEREKRMRSFSAGADVSPMHVTVTTVDQKLMTLIMEKIEENMDNPDYSVEDLASDVCMHRMSLYRKIQSLYGMNPSVFMRTMRLKRAAQLLSADAGLSVVEVSEAVGFGTQKYFTKYFKEMFGVSPSQYKKR